MVTLQSVQGHTGLTHPFLIFWLSARVPECQKIKQGWLDQYGPEHLVDSFLPHSEKVRDWKGQRLCKISGNPDVENTD